MYCSPSHIIFLIRPVSLTIFWFLYSTSCVVQRDILFYKYNYKFPIYNRMAKTPEPFLSVYHCKTNFKWQFEANLSFWTLKVLHWRRCALMSIFNDILRSVNNKLKVFRKQNLYHPSNNKFHTMLLLIIGFRVQK